MNIIDVLKKHESSIRLHIPGHKGKNLTSEHEKLYSLDLTELSDTDNLHHAIGMINEAQQKAAQLYHTLQSRFLINGTTAGILAAMCSSFRPGDKVLIQRNSHLSVYHAALLSDVTLAFSYGDFNGYAEANTLKLEELNKEKYTDIKGILITYPTYVGTCTDIKKIALWARQNNKKLIVDEAHGAHLAFSKKYPISAEECSADIIIQSTHKMLSSLTQSSLLHVGSNMVDIDKLDFYLRIFQSSSPSYILLNSLQQALSYASENAEKIFDQIYTWRIHLQKILSTTHFYLMEDEIYDWSKLWINTKKSNYSGFKIKEILEEKNIYIEYASHTYIIALCGIGTTQNDIIALGNALKTIEKKTDCFQYDSICMPKPISKMKMKEAIECCYQYINLKSAKNKISADFVIAYPPGVPLVIPGEVITEQIIEDMLKYLNIGASIMGIKENSIKIVK